MVCYKMGKFRHKNKCGISCADEDRDQGDVSTCQRLPANQEIIAGRREARDSLFLMVLEEFNPAAV